MREDFRLRMKIGRHAAQPQAEADLFHLGKIAYAAVDDHAFAAARLERRQHHFAEDAAGQAAARVNDNDIARLASDDGFAMQFALGRGGVFIAPMHVFALGHELQRDGLAGDAGARAKGRQADHVRVADALLRQRPGDRSRADFAQAIYQALVNAFECWDFDHIEFVVRLCRRIGQIISPAARSA